MDGMTSRPSCSGVTLHLNMLSYVTISIFHFQHEEKRTWEEDHYAALRRFLFILLHGHIHPPLHGVGMEVAENETQLGMPFLYGQSRREKQSNH